MELVTLQQMVIYTRPKTTYFCSDCPRFFSDCKNDACVHLMYHLDAVKSYVVKEMCSTCNKEVKDESHIDCGEPVSEICDLRRVILSYMACNGQAFPFDLTSVNAECVKSNPCRQERVPVLHTIDCPFNEGLTYPDPI